MTSQNGVDDINTDSDSDNHLAIVIPAYKARFLRQALESISEQTDTRFKVYVGDDASPEDLKVICDDFRDRLNLSYLRFTTNLGQKSLAGHWNRCIELSAEPWIWLFCDDDVMEPKCAALFYQTLELEKDRHNVFRFDTLAIDDDHEIIRINPPHPLRESGIEFIYHRLKGERRSYVSEYIFARTAYEESGGMIEFPLAWCSDDASWLAFSGKKNILTIKGAHVRWRRGAYNITPSGAKHQTQRMEAAFRFVHWLSDFLEVNEARGEASSRDTLEKLSKSWFLNQIRGVTPIRLSNWRVISEHTRAVTGKSLASCWLLILGYNLRFYFKTLKKLARPT